MYQRTLIIGNVGRDPEMRYTPSGVPVTSFSVAVNRRWKNQQGEPQEKTTWFRVTAWRKLGEWAAQYIQKGKLILVEGDVEASAYADKDGSPRASLELTATSIRFVGAKGEGEMTPVAGGAPAHAADEFGGGNEDDLPF